MFVSATCKWGGGLNSLHVCQVLHVRGGGGVEPPPRLSSATCKWGGVEPPPRLSSATCKGGGG